MDGLVVLMIMTSQTLLEGKGRAVFYAVCKSAV